MAGNRKQYEMLFALNASLNGSFRGTMSKAQQEFARLGKEIQDLQKLQANVSSYQKQEQAIASTTGKLSNLRQQEALLQQQIDAVRNAENQDIAAVAALEREKLKLEQRIRGTEEALERQKQKLESTGAKLKEAGVDTGNLAQKDAELTAKIKELKAEQDKAADSAASFGERAAQGLEAVQSVLAAVGLTEALRGIADAYRECVTRAADFEEAMSNVGALSQAGAREMEALSTKAKELGAETKFTAQESAAAMGYMAMAGWDANEMLQGMNGVLQLAAASGEDLAMVSDIVTDSLSAFGLTAADTAHFSDVLAAAATNSNTNVSIMGETFKMSASVAGALGYSIEDVATAMGLMANSGVKGSIAGTALRNTFNGLLAGVTLTGAAFGEYEYSAVRANGTMKDFGSTIDELRGYFEKMTEAERVANAQAIAGQRGYNGLLAILNATDDDYRSLSDSINNCTGAAQRMAKIKLDNLNGQLTLMNSAWEALQVTLGEQFNPELRKLAETGTDVLGWLNEFVKGNPQLVKSVIAFTAAIAGAAGAITAVNAAIKVFKALDMAAAFTSLPGMIIMAAGAMAGLIAASWQLAEVTDRNLDAWEDLLDTHRKALDTYHENTAAIEDESGAVLGMLNSLRELSGQSEKTAAEQAQIAELCNQLNAAVPELSLSYDAQADSLSGLTGSLDSYIERLYQAQRREKDVARLVELRGSITETAEALETARARVEELEAEMDRMAHEGSDTYGINMELSRYHVKAAELTRLLSEEQAEYDSLSASVDAYSAAQEDAAENTSALEGVITSARNQIDQLAAAYREAYDAALDSISGQYDLWDKAEKVSSTSASSITAALESQISYWEKYNANLASLGDRSADIEGLSEMIATFADGSKDSVNAIAGMAGASDKDLRTMVDKWQELQEQQSETSESLAELVSGFPEQVDQLVSAMEKGVEGMSLPEEAEKSARDTLQAFIDEADTMLPLAQSAYARVGRAASNSLGFRDMTARKYDPAYINQYASGTSSAPPGWAWVGEEGPELIRMRGGETVLPAEISREFTLLSAWVKNEPAAYAGGTGNALEMFKEYQSSTLFSKRLEESAGLAEIRNMSDYHGIVSGDTARLAETVNNAWSDYNAAVYGDSVYGTVLPGVYSYGANAPDAGPEADARQASVFNAQTAVPALEAIPSFAPITVEVHIHLEGSAAPEAVDQLRDYVDSGGFKERVREAMEEINADARRGYWG